MYHTETCNGILVYELSKLYYVKKKSVVQKLTNQLIYKESETCD